MTADTPRVKRPYLRLLAAAVASLAVLSTANPGPAVGAQAGASTATRSTAARIGEPTTFQLSSFNVLGANHTSSGGRFASGLRRIGLAVRLLDQHGVDVVGFQELQLEQYTEFTRLAGDRYGIYPGGLNRRIVQNSIAWDLASWKLVEGHTIKIPYFKGEEWQMPIVLLQNTLTGQLAYFANFHNPATNRRHHGNQKWRTEATRRQVAMANTLISQTSLPLFITGDMNEREEYYCAMAGGAPMKAANGGKHKQGVCTPPPYPMPVDWIFGAKGRMKFSNYVRDNSRLVRRITDHFVIRADVTIPTSWTDPTLPPAPPVWPLPIEPTEPTYPPPPCPTAEPTDPTYPEPTEPTWPAPPCPTEPAPTDPTEPTYPAAG